MYQTPYEGGNGNQTTTWSQCIAFYEKLAAAYPQQFKFEQLGVSDAGIPIHVGLVSADGEFDRARIQAAGRTVFFNNNGIHPGEPEGVDACMALVRDLCTQPEYLARLGQAVYLFIPIYNVDGCLNRADTSRTNQLGPETFGFRGNSRHLDLNRDFIKCDSLNAQLFNRLITAWDPDVMVDTHTSNGADYSYTMTLIHTQADKLGGALGAFLKNDFLPEIFAGMEQQGWPTCPYVNPTRESPDQGIEEFLEVPRFSTGFTALHHVIGFMPETHMLKPFADRYASMRALLDVTLALTVKHGAHIRRLRQQARQEGRARTSWPVSWKADDERPSKFRFKGYAAKHKPSVIGDYSRLWYDRNEPWEAEIDYFDRFVEDTVVAAPQAYVVPQQWREVIQRLEWNGVVCERLASDVEMRVKVYRIQGVKSRSGAYEGHMFHDDVQVQAHEETLLLRAGDVKVTLDQDQARYAVETLEPQAHDSFFRWGFFNSVLEKKEHYSDYIFEDHALELLNTEPALREKFEAWKAAHPALLSQQSAVLDFIFENCARYQEPEWMRYPVVAIPK